jgi:hypothetical protein
MTTYGLGDGDDRTVRYGTDPDAASQADRTVRMDPRDESGGYTVPQVPDDPTVVVAWPPTEPVAAPRSPTGPAASSQSATEPVAETWPPTEPVAAPWPPTEPVAEAWPPTQPGAGTRPPFEPYASQFSGSQAPPQLPPAPLPQRVPAQFQPLASGRGTGTGAPGRGSNTPITSIRIGNGVVPVKPARSREGRTSARRWFGRLTRILSGIATVVLIAAAAWTGWQWWQRAHNKVQVTNVSVVAAQPASACDVQFDVVGTLATNGQPGTISYEWLRSDGQSSGTLKLTVAEGQKSATVHLYWKFTGEGSMDATATLDVLTPTKTDAAAQFAYSCP